MILAIASVVKDHASGEKGIAERNKAKLREIVGARQQRLIDLGEILIDEVNHELDRRARKRRGVQRVELIDAEVARDVMCAVASDILLARAPRKDNLMNALLSWISWQDELATIRVPNVEVKNRSTDDEDLVIPLGPNESRRLRLYLDKVRPRALRHDDKANPFLFPAQGPTVGPAQFSLRRTDRTAHAAHEKGRRHPDEPASLSPSRRMDLAQEGSGSPARCAAPARAQEPRDHASTLCRDR
jgi:hypothetical protein